MELEERSGGGFVAVLCEGRSGGRGAGAAVDFFAGGGGGGGEVVGVELDAGFCVCEVCVSFGFLWSQGERREGSVRFDSKTTFNPLFSLANVTGAVASSGRSSKMSLTMFISLVVPVAEAVCVPARAEAGMRVGMVGGGRAKT